MCETRHFFLILLLSFSFSALPAQDPAEIKAMIASFKEDIRGPYKDIRWFCEDGTVIPPKEKCPEPGGVQRARYKNEVVDLAKKHHIFLGQILSTTSRNEFWDQANNQSRIKQYQLEKYLRLVDDGWVLQKGQYYRGAIQEEDEQAWGLEFLKWLVVQDSVLEKNYFLLRQVTAEIPHKGDDDLMRRIRAVSMTISDAYPAFQNLRVKIHGQPEKSDIDRVLQFQKNNQTKLGTVLNQQIASLLEDMRKVYSPMDLNTLKGSLASIPKDSRLYARIQNFIQFYSGNVSPAARSMEMAQLLLDIRQELPQLKGSKARLAALDMAQILDQLLFTEVQIWKTSTLRESMQKTCYLGMAATGAGLLELWEWDRMNDELTPPADASISIAQVQIYMERARAVVEWGTNMIRAVYKDVVGLFTPFEPLASGFFDDKIRASILLSMGLETAALGDFVAKEANLSNQVLDLSNQSQMRGLNPGFALGELVVVEESAESVEVSKDKIYIFNVPPADLKPVAGIMTVTEGNMVSHVQLLARNLGIPNAVLTLQNLQALKKYQGQKVFLAVSNRGTIVMKKATEMTQAEKALFEVKVRSEERISVPVEKMDLAAAKILNLREVDATSSGKLCGPKAANLGQLKKLFPDKVVEGLVIPFGIFRKHMDQPMPGTGESYWQFLNRSFQEARSKSETGASESEVELFVLERLGMLREAIKQMPLSPDFVESFKTQFRSILGSDLGHLPVFLRSDTNMEDLKDFTGAGLNLTLFNVVDEARILQGIKDVWASPYTERSFRWRQRYLLNPENVFPSILVIPSVDVDYSGVLITKGLTTGIHGDLTIAFNYGAGGAVDGQAAETYLISHKGPYVLLAPAREPRYRSLPASGGTKTQVATFQKPILNLQNIWDLRLLAYQVYQVFPKTEGMPHGPFDMELGFKDDKLWLFQIRPFVENKNALSSAYLESISPELSAEKMIDLNSKL